MTVSFTTVDSSTSATGKLTSCESHIKVCHRLIGYDFPWEMNRALELAVLKTFCVPRIAQILRKTGEFVHRPQKRYDDTSLILGNIMKWGYDSPRGQAAIAKMRHIHQQYDICNEDFLYVLSVLIYEPVRWNQCYGWRLFTKTEKQSLFQFWQAVGKQMGIRNIPPTFETFEHFNQTYEAAHFCYSPDNQIIGEAVLALMQSWLPSLLAPIVPFLVKATINAPMRDALGWSQPPQPVCWAVHQGLRWSRKGVRWLPRRRLAHFAVDTPNITYPHGYRLEDLGPDARGNAEAPSSPSRCPFLRMQSFLKNRN